MSLPESCSFVAGSSRCQIPPAFVISVKANESDYMVGVACQEHKDVLLEKMASLQKSGRLPQGAISFQTISTVTTDCVVGLNDDYVDIELQRSIESDRKMD
jgi:hypothetical protein